MFMLGKTSEHFSLLSLIGLEIFMFQHCLRFQSVKKQTKEFGP